jgi:hypothetical protein
VIAVEFPFTLDATYRSSDMTEMTPTAYGALVTAAQTGQVMVGPYASQEVITQLVGAGFGSYITEPGRGSALRVIGFEINEKGRNAVRTGAPRADLQQAGPLCDMNLDLINHVAATIRRVDGGHTMGAGALAEAIVADGLDHIEETAALKERMAIVAYLRGRAEKARRDAGVPSMGVAFGAFFDQMADEINRFADREGRPVRLSDLVDLYGDKDPVIAVVDPETGIPVDPAGVDEGLAVLAEHGPYPYIAFELPREG